MHEHWVVFVTLIYKQGTTADLRLNVSMPRLARPVLLNTSPVDGLMPNPSNEAASPSILYLIVEWLQPVTSSERCIYLHVVCLSAWQMRANTKQKLPRRCPQCYESKSFILSSRLLALNVAKIAETVQHLDTVANSFTFKLKIITELDNRKSLFI